MERVTRAIVSLHNCQHQMCKMGSIFYSHARHLQTTRIDQCWVQNSCFEPSHARNHSTRFQFPENDAMKYGSVSYEKSGFYKICKAAVLEQKRKWLHVERLWRELHKCRKNKGFRSQKLLSMLNDKVRMAFQNQFKACLKGPWVTVTKLQARHLFGVKVT